MGERVAKNELLGFLEAFNSELNRKILLIAVGGTAMTLLGIKPSTKDVDFNIPSKEDFDEFKRVEAKISPGVRIDSYSSNMVFSEILPEDYVELATNYELKLDKISLRILNPLDIICSKISRFNEPDRQDIRDCIRNFKITKEQIKNRSKGYERAGSDKVFEEHLEDILQNMF